MFAKADGKYASHIGLVSAGTVVAGDIHFSGGLRIDGEVRGDVRALDGRSGTLIIGEKGRVVGNIEVTRLVVNGLVTGRVGAMESVRIQSKACLHCDVEYASVEIHAGAVVQGHLLQRRHVAVIEESPQALPLAPLERAPAAI